MWMSGSRSTVQAHRDNWQSLFSSTPALTGRFWALPIPVASGPLIESHWKTCRQVVPAQVSEASQRPD